MTALEYMEKQVRYHRLNYDRESVRWVPKELLHNIKVKIQHYEAAVEALKQDEKEKAHWVKDGENLLCCSNCNAARNFKTQVWWNFCPMCGATMGGE